ncbi:glycosyltransferase family 4 protein [Rhizobium halophytocola]|nr:glycosyltransferase family 4 protein [Rhizobium halophytocola]
MRDRSEVCSAAGGFAPDGQKRAPVDAVEAIERVVVIDDYSVARGGATTLALKSAELLRGLDIPVTYICGDAGAQPRLADAGISVVPLGGADLLHMSRVKALVTGIHNAAAAQLLRDWIAANDTPGTVYHVHGWSKILSPSIFKALAPVADRCVVHAHDFFAACPNGAYFDYQDQAVCDARPGSFGCLSRSCDKRNYAQKLWRAARGVNVERLLRDNAVFGRIILLHDKMRPFFERAGYDAQRLTTIANPVSVASPQRVEVEANREFFFIGRLDPEKGIEDALAAVEMAGVKLCVIGDGPLLPKVLAAGDNVRWLGWLSHEEIAAAISGARALVMSSRYPEPLGLVAVEAASFGVPVVMTEQAFIASDMVSAGMAVACDTSSADILAARLLEVLDMPEAVIRTMSEIAFRDWPSLALTQAQWRDALIEQYAGLLPEKNAGQTVRAIASGGFLQ